MMEMQQQEWVTAQISWDGINFARISIPKVFYSDFLKAWERGDVWEEIQNLEKEGKMTEDERSRAKDELQKVVDEANKNLEVLFEKKEKEVVG